jgi:hypothetical protein
LELPDISKSLGKYLLENIFKTEVPSGIGWKLPLQMMLKRREIHKQQLLESARISTHCSVCQRFLRDEF